VFVFITIASSFFQRKYALTPTQANHYVALPYTVSAIISPFLGFIIDSIGYSAQWVFLSSVSGGVVSGILCALFFYSCTMCSRVVQELFSIAVFIGPLKC
jgi:MFS family permease